MKCRLIGTCMLAAAATVAVGLDAGTKAPAFKSGQYVLTVTEVVGESSVNYAQPRKTKRTVHLAGSLKVPNAIDVVAASTQLAVIEAVDERGQSLLKARRHRKSRGYRSGTYAPVDRGSAAVAVELDRTELTAHPHELRKMTVQATVIVAGKRRSKHVPAAVMDQPVKLVEGLEVRIAALALTPKRELNLVIEYQRGRGGPGFPFIESVYVIDKDGKRIGGGRWQEGDPLAAKGKVVCHFPLPEGTAHQRIKIVAVTEDELKEVPFDLEKIFQE